MVKRGFTLIELLVVVAIIAILMAILLPSLSKAREQAKSVKCLANLKQLAAGFHMYTDLHDGKLPEFKYVNTVYIDGTRQFFWYQQLVAANVLPDGTTKDPGGSSYWVRGCHTSIWSCPAVAERDKNYRAGGADWTGGWGGGYGVMEYNVFLDAGATRSGFPTNGSPRITNIYRQASIWLIGDVGRPDGAGGYFTWISTYSKYPSFYNRADTSIQQPAARHSKDGVNVAFIDGHAETRSWDSVNTNVDDIQAYRSY